MDRVEQLKKIQAEALELFTRKNADYGDAFAKYGQIGVLIRIEDKIQRALSITKNSCSQLIHIRLSMPRKRLFTADSLPHLKIVSKTLFYVCIEFIQ